MRKKTKSETAENNLRELPTPPAAVERPSQEAVIGPEQLAELRDLDQALARAKIDLANLEIQYEAGRRQIIENVLTAQRTFADRAKNIAISLGLDLDNSAWTLNFSTGTFQKKS